jgi:predicted nucleotidyltransferase
VPEDMPYTKISQAVMDSLSPGLVGLYLHGSLALDDFVEGKSDVDLCAVVPELRDQRQKLT